MTTLAEMVDFLDRELKISEIPDYPGALNGLQLESVRDVSRVVAAVDASGQSDGEAAADAAEGI